MRGTCSACSQVYRRTYSWAQNNDDASRGAFITISRASATPRFSEEDIERGISHEIPAVPEVQSFAPTAVMEASRTSLHAHVMELLCHMAPSLGPTFY